MPSLVHTLLATNSYRVTEDGGINRDSETLFATVAQKIIFRGTIEALHRAFPVGKKMSATEDRMFCAGATGIRLFDGTASDPHWEWVGIHKGVSGSADPDFIYRIEDEFSRAETEFPKKFQNSAGLEYTLAINSPFVSEPFYNPFTGGPKRARLITFIPSKKITGLLVSDIPVSPAHLKIFNLINTFGAPDASLLRDWWPSVVRQWTTEDTPTEEELAARIAAAKASTYIPDPLWTWASKYLEGGGDDGGAWVPAGLQVHRHLSTGSLRAFTMTVGWEGRVQPG